MEIAIARLEPAQWPVLREMRLASLAESPDAFWATLADEAAFDQARWDSFVTAAAWFVATRDGQRVGIVGALTRPDAPDEPELIGMWVAPQARRDGVGAQLVDAVCQWATAQGIRCGTTGCRRRQRRRTPRLCAPGFEDTGEQVPFPHDPNRVEVRMRKQLPHGRPGLSRS